MQIIGKGTKIDISGHKAIVLRIDKEGVVCQLEGKIQEFVIEFEQIENALRNIEKITE